MQAHTVFEGENNSRVDYYVLAPGVSILFNRIYTGTWEKGDMLASDRILNLNFCINGRCDVSLNDHQYAIVKKNQVCISTILPDKDFYYPGKLYEGIQMFIDLRTLEELGEQNYLIFLGIDPNDIEKTFCSKKGIYFRQMDDTISGITAKAWAAKENLKIPQLRYLTAQLLHEVMTFPVKSEGEPFFTRSQIAIVKEAEALILEDLSRRYTAKQMADRFGISESSFKLYIKGILGDSYLSYFRRKRMEKAAELLISTNMKVIDIAISVGYENQGKFARVFADTYGMPPLEFRRLPSYKKIK